MPSVDVKTTDNSSPGGYMQAQTVDVKWVTPPSSKKARRSYVLQRDFRVLEQEQRVTKILNSGAFRSELEGILKSQVEGSRRPPKLSKAIQRLQDNTTSVGHGQRTISPQATAPVLPINDLRGVNTSKYTLAERHLRCKLAAVYRLVDLFGWGQLIHNHITVSWYIYMLAEATPLFPLSCMSEFCLQHVTCRGFTGVFAPKS